MFRILKYLLLGFILLNVAALWTDDGVPAASVKIPAKPPASSGIYVQDYAGVISAPVRSYLLDLGHQLDQKTTAQLVVVTVKNLDGAPLEEYSLKLLREWGIGSKEKNNGVLLLISTGDRKSRVEVGYGLEGALTDSLTGQIQDQYMIPYFREGTYEAGIVYGYEALALRIAKEYNVRLAVSGYANHSPGSVKAGSGGQSTDELFDKALAEQNGVTGSSTAIGQGNTDPDEKPVTGGIAQGNANILNNTSGQQGGTGIDSEDSPVTEKEEPKGITGYILQKCMELADTFGWFAILLVLVILDAVFLNGTLTSLFFRIIFFFFSGGGGGSSGGGFSGGGFGGGSGGGGGSSRSW